MKDSLLVQLLKAGLLGELATDGDRLGHAVEAAERVSDLLSGDGAMSVAAALRSALDEDGDSEAEMLVRAADELLKLWPMMTNAFDGGKPTELLRAVLLQAVFDAVDSNNDVAVAVWMLMRNSVDLGVPVRSWQPVVDAALSGLSDKVIKILDMKWSDSGGGAAQLRMPEIEPATGLDLDFEAMDSFDEAIVNVQPAQMHPQVGTHLPRTRRGVQPQSPIPKGAHQRSARRSPHYVEGLDAQSGSIRHFLDPTTTQASRYQAVGPRWPGHRLGVVGRMPAL